MRMEVARRRIRHLEPARPLRRLNGNQEVHRIVDAEAVLKPADKPVNTIRVEQFYEILKIRTQSQAPAKPDRCQDSERISYSRDFLIRLANSPLAMKRPEFLPEHPVVLEKARDQDIHKLFVNDCKKWDMTA